MSNTMYMSKQDKRNRMDSFDKFMLCNNYSLIITAICSVLGIVFFFHPESQPPQGLELPFSFFCGIAYLLFLNIFKKTLFTTNFTF